MKRYIGSKIVLAQPMTRQEYNDFRGWTMPVDEDGTDRGYLVEYQDGGKPNVPGRAGYVSWSPKEQFDAAYKPRPLVRAAPYQQRVVDEKRDLDDKIAALDKFISGGFFQTVPSEEQARQRVQLDAMRVYSSILNMRINAFT